MKKAKIIITVFVMVMMQTNIFAQEADTYKDGIIQITLFQPLGNTGIKSKGHSGSLPFNCLFHIKQVGGGFQLSSTNVTRGNFTGLQLGCFNYADRLNGIQLGIINIVNKIESGTPIGLFNIVKNGLYEFELTTGETIYSNLSYKMGTKKFYTIFNSGISSYKNKPVYANGLGIGRYISLTEKSLIDLNVSANQITYSTSGDTDLNLLNKMNLNYKYDMNEHISFLIGSSLNVYFTTAKTDGKFGTLDIPYELFAEESENNKTFIWIGINAGISLKI